MAEKLRISRHEDGFEVVGNREGLRDLAEACLALSRLSMDTIPSIGPTPRTKSRNPPSGGRHSPGDPWGVKTEGGRLNGATIYVRHRLRILIQWRAERLLAQTGMCSEA
jgi:hypothetical protein